MIAADISQANGVFDESGFAIQVGIFHSGSSVGNGGEIRIVPSYGDVQLDELPHNSAWQSEVNRIEIPRKTTPHNLKMEVRQNRILGFLDGEQFGSLQNRFETFGVVGLGRRRFLDIPVQSDTDEVTFRISNLSIQKLDQAAEEPKSSQETPFPFPDIF